MSVLQTLVGQTVRAVRRDSESLALEFEAGSVLVVYNRYRYEGGSLEDLVKSIVRASTEDPERIVLSFSTGLTVSVGLEGNDYSGPEAMQFVRPGEPIVVWS